MEDNSFEESRRYLGSNVLEQVFAVRRVYQIVALAFWIVKNTSVEDALRDLVLGLHKAIILSLLAIIINKVYSTTTRADLNAPLLHWLRLRSTLDSTCWWW